MNSRNAVPLPEPAMSKQVNAFTGGVMDVQHYTATQLQAYGEAMRREALEEAALVAGGLYQHYRDLYKGRVEPVDKEHWYNPHTDGVADGAGMAEDAIREQLK